VTPELLSWLAPSQVLALVASLRLGLQQGYNYNKTKLLCIQCKYHIYQNFLKYSKNGKHEFHAIVYVKKNLNKICMLLSNLKRPLSKPIFISHHVMCSSISCNHLDNMLMNVKLIVIQLELNGIGYIVVFHSYSKFA
jgi:hypothetical protein